MKLNLAFLIQTPNAAEVLVRWDRALDRPRYGRYVELETVFEEIEGVEHVRLRRYHAVLEVNLDITTVSAVKEAVRAYLVDSVFAEDLAQEFDVEVVVV